jgi:hypothetical protein
VIYLENKSWDYVSIAAVAGILLVPLAFMAKSFSPLAMEKKIPPDGSVYKMFKYNLWAIAHAIEEVDFDRLRDPMFGGRIFAELKEKARQLAPVYPKLPSLIDELEELCRRGNDAYDALKAAVQLQKITDYILTGE